MPKRQELLAASKEVVWENHSVRERLGKPLFFFWFLVLVGEGREGCDMSMYDIYIYTHMYMYNYAMIVRPRF